MLCLFGIGVLCSPLPIYFENIVTKLAQWSSQKTVISEYETINQKFIASTSYTQILNSLNQIIARGVPMPKNLPIPIPDTQILFFSKPIPDTTDTQILFDFFNWFIEMLINIK